MQAHESISQAKRANGPKVANVSRGARRLRTSETISEIAASSVSGTKAFQSSTGSTKKRMARKPSPGRSGLRNESIWLR